MKTALLFLCGLATCLAASVDYGKLSWRIVGGKDAAEGQFPYQVSLRQASNFHFCGGSILDETTILCAAHCVEGNSPGSFNVHVGINQLSQRGVVHKVSKIVIHRDWDRAKLQNDISIIKLASPIQFNDKVQPIALPTSNIGADDCVLSGWGSTRLGGSAPNDLQFINLRSITFEDCKSKQPNFPIVDSEICTLTKSGEGACHGDSGGPLVSNGVQVGIVSWGTPCAKGYPDVFTRVHSFVSWININRQ